MMKKMMRNGAAEGLRKYGMNLIWQRVPAIYTHVSLPSIKYDNINDSNAS